MATKITSTQNVVIDLFDNLGDTVTLRINNAKEIDPENATQRAQLLENAKIVADAVSGSGDGNIGAFLYAKKSLETKFVSFKSATYEVTQKRITELT